MGQGAAAITHTTMEVEGAVNACPPPFQSIRPPSLQLEQAAAAPVQVVVAVAAAGREYRRFLRTVMSHHLVLPQAVGQLLLPSGRTILIGAEEVT